MPPENNSTMNKKKIQAQPSPSGTLQSTFRNLHSERILVQRSQTFTSSQPPMAYLVVVMTIAFFPVPYCALDLAILLP
jgi:hypothetical protein